MATLNKREWMRRRRKRQRMKKLAALVVFALIIILLLVLVVKFISFLFGRNEGMIKKAGDYKVTASLLTESEHTRSGQSMDEVKNIVIHDTGSPNTTAKQMYDYYENIGKSGTVTESVHFVIDTDGKILQLIPCDEIAFHAMSANENSIAIQFCYSAEDGTPSSSTYNAMVALCVKLCKEYDLTADDILTHYEVSARNCPLYYVTNNESWEKFKADVEADLN